jgi:flavin reductase (DIM6/NTAB) family NADH-FMN oxidoreductase RutF
MYEGFTECRLKSLDENVFSLLDDVWMLITAGKKNSLNTMTASWGGFGFLWNKPVAFIFIRPQRHTLGYIKEQDNFTLSFFDSKYKDILSYCGSVSGKTVDKIEETGLIPVETMDGGVFFKQSYLMMECRKLYTDQIKPGNFIIRELEEKIYREKDYHYMFIGEITSCMKRSGRIKAKT